MIFKIMEETELVTKKSRYVTMGIVKSVVEFINSVYIDSRLSDNKRVLGIMGGEPVSHPRFVEVISYILDNIDSSIDVTIYSNGEFALDETMFNDMVTLLNKYDMLNLHLITTRRTHENHDEVMSRMPELHKSLVDFVDSKITLVKREEKISTSYDPAATLDIFKILKMFKGDMVNSVRYSKNTRTDSSSIPIVRENGELYVGNDMIGFLTNKVGMVLTSHP